MSAPLILVAASGLARETAASARRAGRTVLGCVDDDPGRHGGQLAPGVPILGGAALVSQYPEADLVICAGKGAVRGSLEARLGDLGVLPSRYASVIDPSVHVPAGCSVGAGSILLAGCVLTADVHIGRHVVCMPSVVLTHDDRVDDLATLCAGVVLGGGVRVGAGAYVGMAACVRESVSIGANAVLGMGSVLLRDLPEGQTWSGCPARRMKEDV